MRIVSMIFIWVCMPLIMFAQQKDPRTWNQTVFRQGEVKGTWMQQSGTWTVGASGISATGSDQAVTYPGDLFIIGDTTTYVVETEFSGSGGGLVFGMESGDLLANSHYVLVRGGQAIIGYFDFLGNRVESRVLNLANPGAAVTLSVEVRPAVRTYAVSINGEAFAQEELRYRDGFTGLLSTSAKVQFSRFSVRGAALKPPAGFFVKSNKPQVHHLSYLTTVDDALLTVDPVAKIVQRVTSVGSYVNEIQVTGENSDIRGVAIDASKNIFVADYGQNAVRVYNKEMLSDFVITGDLNKPRGVAVAGGTIYVLDASGIKLFDLKGTFLGAKLVGAFKDPKNLYITGDHLYVTDFGNGDVKLFDRSTFTLKKTIKDQLVRPWDVCVDPEDEAIYVADPGAMAVLVFDKDGDFRMRIDPITIKGFYSPRAVRVKNDKVYVGDLWRILVFKKGTTMVRPSFRIPREKGPDGLR